MSTSRFSIPPLAPACRLGKTGSLALLAGLAAVVAVSCKPEAKEPPREATLRTLSATEVAYCVEKGNAACAALMQNLSAQLKAALAAGGPEQAVTVCQQAALPITATTSGQVDGVEISRTSRKVRNPRNAPSDLDTAILDEWQALIDGGNNPPSHSLQVHGPDQAVFHKPIVVQPVCVTCHGDRAAMTPALRDRLATLYPQDAAHGYREGDLRGAFRVVITLPDPEPDPK